MPGSLLMSCGAAYSAGAVAGFSARLAATTDGAAADQGERCTLLMLNDLPLSCRFAGQRHLPACWPRLDQLVGKPILASALHVL